ncbi:hypothetical protein WL00_11365 [Burkholderia cepacia]|nr:hypothetical protein WL00_11365 [Burkholderia cepacia]KVX72581.1 hypothetical protein WL07_13460 [Burkholderia cepacia]
MVVIRPTDPAKFNGTVLVEWLNVTSGYDIPVHWLQQKDMILRKGYAWVGVSAQDAGISNATTGLKVWSPSRYGTLNVTNGGKITGDRLSYDIFSQAAKAIRASSAVMGGLSVKKVIAVGASQSAGRLGLYLNAVHPRTGNIYDAALLSVGGPTMRTDLSIPVMKVLSETELTNTSTNEVPALQADTNKFHIWQVAGGSHTEAYGLAARAAIVLRDLKQQIGDSCTYPSRSRIPIRYAFNSAIDKLEKYIDNGTPLPTATPMQVVTSSPPSVALDTHGNALAGVRLPEADVPVALDNGTNAGSGLCFLNGTHIPFDKATLDSLYPTHDAYVSKFVASANAAQSAGFLLPEDAQESIANAQASIVGYQLNCGTLCADVGQFTQNPSSSQMRMHLFAYGLPDRATLLAPIDAATRFIATGYLNTDPTAARPSFQLAIASLQQYAALIQTELQNDALSQQAADYLTNQVSVLATALGKL